MIELRSSQGAAIEQTRAEIAAGNRRVVIVAPCGFGKSVVGAEFMRATVAKGRKVWFCVDRQILVNQMSQMLHKYGIDHGVMMADHPGWKQSQAQVVSLQTIEKRGWDANIDVLVVDECFPAGTKILTTMGEKNIDLVRCGDHVYTQHGIGEVKSTSSRPATETYRLELSDGTVIECTGNHRIFTATGWQEAQGLEIGARLFTIKGMRSLWGNVSALDQAGCEWKGDFSRSRSIVDRAKMLLDIVCQEIEESDEQSSIAPENESQIARDSAHAYPAWRQRAIATLATACAASRIGRGMGIGVSDSDEDEAFGDGNADLLQTGLGKSDAEDRDRNRRPIAHGNKSQGTGLEESNFFGIRRLVRVSRIERESAIPVFNLHVGGHPSYFANGIAVHNCHANMRKVLLDHLEREPRIVVVGLTATPFTKGMGKVYASVVNPTTTNKQIEEGFLVPLKIYSCKAADMTDARTIAGEYVDSEVSERGKKIVGDIVSTWVEKTTEHFGGPVKSIVFTADVTHGADVCKAFTGAGYRFEQISYLDANQDRRDALIKELRNPDSGLWGLVSCGVLTRGFDVTNILCGIDARPLRKSLSEVVQKIGRVQRAHQGKTFALWLDHAGNVERFGAEIFDLFENGVKSLDEADAKPPRKDVEESEKKEVFCPRCGLLRPGRALTCACGYEWPRKRTVEVVPGELREVMLGNRKMADDERHLYAQIVTYNRGWGNPGTVNGRSWHHFKQVAGKQPPSSWHADKTATVEVTQAVAGKLKSMRIAYRKRAA